jgi:hypothetical protein
MAPSTRDTRNWSGRPVRGDPFFDDALQLAGAAEDFFRVGVGGDERPVVVDFIAFAAADFKVIGQRSDAWSHGEGQGVESRLVMTARLGVETIACAGQCHLCQQERRAVGGHETRVRRDLQDARVLKLDRDGGAQLVELGAAGAMPFDPPLRLQFLPGHEPSQ